jgi:hypothetical protein
MVDLKDRQIYEIKPIGQLEEGVAQLTGYCVMFNYLDGGPGHRWLPGYSYDFPLGGTSTNPIALGWFGTYAIVSPSGGLIIYDIGNKYVNMSLATAGAAVGVRSIIMSQATRAAGAYAAGLVGEIAEAIGFASLTGDPI